MSLAIAVTTFFCAYIPVLRAYNPSICVDEVITDKLSRSHPTHASALQMRSRSTVNPTVHDKDPSPPSSPSSPVLSSLLSPSPPPLPKPTSSLSTDSSLSSTPSPKHVSVHKTMRSQLKFTSVQQDSPSKVPILLPGDISPYVMRSYELACHGYFNTKDIEDDKKV
jgi:hypothetical protein